MRAVDLASQRVRGKTTYEYIHPIPAQQTKDTRHELPESRLGPAGAFRAYRRCGCGCGSWGWEMGGGPFRVRERASPYCAGERGLVGLGWWRKKQRESAAAHMTQLVCVSLFSPSQLFPVFFSDPRDPTPDPLPLMSILPWTVAKKKDLMGRRRHTRPWPWMGGT